MQLTFQPFKTPLFPGFCNSKCWSSVLPFQMPVSLILDTCLPFAIQDAGLADIGCLSPFAILEAGLADIGRLSPFAIRDARCR